MHAPHRQTPDTPRWRRVAIHLAVALLVVGAGVAFNILFPTLAFAQGGGEADPFAEAEVKFTNFLDRMQFWVWGVSAMGLAFYVIAYGGQALWPSWYGSMRDFLRNGAVLIVIFNVVFAFLREQGGGGKKAGSFVIILPYLLWHLYAAHKSEQAILVAESEYKSE